MQNNSKINKQIVTILASIDPHKMVTAKASNIQITDRSMRFDIPDGSGKDGINRVKVTNMGDGALRVQLLRVEEVDLVGGVPPEKLAQVLLDFVGLDV